VKLLPAMQEIRGGVLNFEFRNKPDLTAILGRTFLSGTCWWNGGLHELAASLSTPAIRARKTPTIAAVKCASIETKASIQPLG